MKKHIKLLMFPFIAILLGSCNQAPSEAQSDEISSQESEQQSEIDSSSNEISSSIEESKSEEVSSSEEIDNTEYTTFVEIDDVNVEEGGKYSLKSILSSFKGLTVISKNIKVASYSLKDGLVIGKKVGETYFVLEYKNQKQKLKVNVVERGTYATNFPFNRGNLEGKKIVAFGDSVTAQSTLGTSGRTYFTNIATKFDMVEGTNYAIGGTTATYTYPGSNIEKEYGSNKSAIDGCRVVYNAYINEELYDVNYAFIAYGHNDQYFQPPVTVQGDDVYCVDNTFKSCHSYKGSYRYMINVLREANPNIRIILLNCTYSEYDKTTISPYGNKYSYTDYRNATKEIAEEMGCRYIDPWDYMKDYFDYKTGKKYYKDSVHLTPEGHNILASYIAKN